MRSVVPIAVAGWLLASSAHPAAHHSFAATYFENKMQTISGTLVQFLFRNPHSFVHVEAPDEKGQVYRWAVEWGAPVALSMQGVTPTVLKVGDRVVITGHPGRNPADHILRMQSIERPSDGWKWSGNFR